MSIYTTLGKLAARHYSDKSSWAGIVVTIAAACHFSLSPEMANAIDGVLAALAGAFLVAADGRTHDSGAGADPAASVPQPASQPTGTASDPGVAVHAGFGTGVGSTQRIIPIVPRIGPDHGAN